MVVLEAPSVSFTEKHWRSSASVAEAVLAHRAVFFEWAKRGKQSKLFNLLLGAVPTNQMAFFRQLYITDVWKDAAFKEKKTDRAYGRYWRDKLATELVGVPKRRVIFVGREAATSGYSMVPTHTPKHRVDFPGRWISETEFSEQLRRLESQIQ